VPLLPTRQLDTVALLEEERRGRVHYAATGFFCRHRSLGQESDDAVFLVTSAPAMRENLEGKVLIGRRRRRVSLLAESVTDKRGFARRKWFLDDESGLAVLPLDPEHLARTRLRFQAVSTTTGTLTLSAMRKKRIGEGDDVLVLALQRIDREQVVLQRGRDRGVGRGRPVHGGHRAHRVSGSARAYQEAPARRDPPPGPTAGIERLPAGGGTAPPLPDRWPVRRR